MFVNRSFWKDDLFFSNKLSSYKKEDITGKHFCLLLIVVEYTLRFTKVRLKSAPGPNRYRNVGYRATLKVPETSSQAQLAIWPYYKQSTLTTGHSNTL